MVFRIILERTWHASQTVEKHSDGSILRVVQTPELEGFIVRWAGGVEVLSPAPLKEIKRRI